MEQPVFYTYSAQQVFRRTLKILRSRRDRLIKKREDCYEDSFDYRNYQSQINAINHDIHYLVYSRDIVIKEVLKEN